MSRLRLTLSPVTQCCFVAVEDRDHTLGFRYQLEILTEGDTMRRVGIIPADGDSICASYSGHLVWLDIMHESAPLTIMLDSARRECGSHRGNARMCRSRRSESRPGTWLVVL